MPCRSNIKRASEFVTPSCPSRRGSYNLPPPRILPHGVQDQGHSHNHQPMQQALPATPVRGRGRTRSSTTHLTISSGPPEGSGSNMSAQHTPTAKPTFPFPHRGLVTPNRRPPILVSPPHTIYLPAELTYIDNHDDSWEGIAFSPTSDQQADVPVRLKFLSNINLNSSSPVPHLLEGDATTSAFQIDARTAGKQLRSGFTPTRDHELGMMTSTPMMGSTHLGVDWLVRQQPGMYSSGGLFSSPVSSSPPHAGHAGDDMDLDLPRQKMDSDEDQKGNKGKRKRCDSDDDQDIKNEQEERAKVGPKKGLAGY